MNPSMVFVALGIIPLIFNQARSFGSKDDETEVASPGASDTTATLPPSVGFYSLTRDEILSLPFRGTENYLQLFPGIVKQDGEFHVRGGRNGELGYMIEGLGTTNRWTNEDGVPVIPEAIDRLDVSTGGYSAEFGGLNSGMVSTHLRTGGDTWVFSGNLLTDDFARPGNKFVGTSSFGYRDAVLTAGGPFPGLQDLRFFIAAENIFMRNRQAMFLSPFELNVTTDRNDIQPGRSLPGPISFKENSIPNNWSEATTVQGSADYAHEALKLRLIGSFDIHRQPNGSEWPDALPRIFNQARTPETKVNSGFLSLHMNHAIDAAASYEIAVSYYNRFSNTLDPDFGDDWRSYTDSLANARKGYFGFLNRWNGPPAYSVIDWFLLDNEHTPNQTYNKNQQRRWSLLGNFSAMVNEHWMVKLGGNMELWTIRLFSIGSIPGLMRFQYGSHGEYQSTFSDAFARRVSLSKAGIINNYGYDVDGNVTSDGPDAPRTPLFISAYVHNDVALGDLTLGLGLRYERFDLDDGMFSGLSSYDIYLDAIDDRKLEKREPSHLVLPRVALTHRVDDKTMLSVQYGAYAQMPALNQMFNGNVFLSRTVVGDRLYATPAGYYAKPERTNLFQMGLARRIGPTMTVSAAFYSKQMNGLLSLRKVSLPSWFGEFNAYVNEDHGSSRGLELGVEFFRSTGIAARLFYSLSEVRGTNSTALSPRGAIELYPPRPLDLANDPLDFNRTHNVTVLLSYLNRDTMDNSIFSGFGVNTVLTFNSGHNFTRMNPVTTTGGVDEWRAGVLPLIDPRYASPTETRNNSVTPMWFNVDVSISRLFALGYLSLKAYVDVLNLFNAKQVVNVYPVTGSADNDGWLQNPHSGLSTQAAMEFYRIINMQNRWAYATATGNDIYGSPRQIRVGMTVQL